MYKYTTGVNLHGLLLLGSAVALLGWEMTVAPIDLVASLQTTTLFIFSASKVPQIVQAFRQKSTGKLDLFMVALQLLGSLTRVFTTLQSVDDFRYALGYIIGSTLSGIMCLQILMYGDKSATTAKKSKKKTN